MRIPFNKKSFFRCVGKNEANAVELFLRGGFDPNSVAQYEHTALHTAAEADATDVIKVLVQYGATVDCRNFISFTPLMLAALAGNYSALDLLLQLGADVNLKAEGGQTALMLAALGIPRSPLDSPQALESSPPTAKTQELRLRYYKSVKVLINHRADVNATLGTGLGAIDLAELSGQPEIIDLLSAAGAVPRVRQ